MRETVSSLVHNFGNGRAIGLLDGLYIMADLSPLGEWEASGEPARRGLELDTLNGLVKDGTTVVVTPPTYGTGHIPDDPGYRRTPFHRLAARLGDVALPPAVSLVEQAPPVMNQAASSSCFGHAAACALYIALRLPWIPSPKGLYGNGRAIDRNPGEPLTDTGTQPNQGFRAMNEFGIKPMRPLADRFSDVETSTVNDEPMLGDLEEEALEVVVGDYGIYSTGQQRVTDICTALAHGKPVCIAIAGGSAAFQAYSGGVLGPLNAPLDHYVVAVGYETAADGSIVLVIRNSWSASWGESGNVRINEAAIQELGDIVVLDVRKA